MKKILFFVVAAFAMLFTSCQKCSNAAEAEQKDSVSAIVVKSDVWRDIIAQMWPAVNAQFPEYSFYESYGTVKKLENGEWGLDHNTFRAAYGCPFKNASVLVYVENDTMKFEQVDEAWLEDVYMTPFVPCDLSLAIETIQKKVDVDPEGMPVVLRHQLYPGVYEPQFLLGSAYDCHSVNVFSLEVDVLLKDTDKLVVEHTGLAAEKALK